MDATEMHLAAYERALKVKGRSPRTIQGYLEALHQLATHAETDDITALDRRAVEDWLIDVMAKPQRTRASGHAGSTPAIRFRQVRAFYNWCIAEEIIDVSPMLRMTEPSTAEVPVPVLSDDEIRALLKTCTGKTFEDRRDNAVLRLWCEPGSPRVAEMAGLLLEDVDLRESDITVRGKGRKTRVIPYGAKTGQAIDRYLRVRSKHRDAALPQMWLGNRLLKPMTASGLEQMLRRRAKQAGIGHAFPHQLRHSSAHGFAAAGGSEADAMRLFGWTTDAMAKHYGASAGVERAKQASRRLSPADRF